MELSEVALQVVSAVEILLVVVLCTINIRRELPGLSLYRVLFDKNYNDKLNQRSRKLGTLHRQSAETDKPKKLSSRRASFAPGDSSRAEAGGAGPASRPRSSTAGSIKYKSSSLSHRKTNSVELGALSSAAVSATATATATATTPKLKIKSLAHRRGSSLGSISPRESSLNAPGAPSAKDIESPTSDDQILEDSPVAGDEGPMPPASAPSSPRGISSPRTALFKVLSSASSFRSADLRSAAAFVSNQNDLYSLALAKLLNRVIILGCVLCVLVSVDPTTEYRYFGPHANISFLIVQSCLGYLCLCCWLFSWVKFYLDYKQVKSKKIAKLRVMGFAATLLLNSSLAAALVLCLNLQNSSLAIQILFLMFLVHLTLSSVLFGSLSMYFTYKTIEFLKQSVYRSKNVTMISKLYKKTLAANVVFSAIVIICLISLVTGKFEHFEIADKNPLFVSILSVLAPALWGVLLFFNWISSNNLKDDGTPKASNKFASQSRRVK